MKTGLFFGSFNPVHIGHMALANYFVEYTDIDELWFVISPHNPLKKKESLLNDQLRLDMVELAIDNDVRFRSCDVEFRMPTPSYTIDTLTRLTEKHPEREFVLIMGADGLPSFHKWKNYEMIITQYRRYVYPRPGYPIPESNEKDNLVVMEKAPFIDISSSFIRSSFEAGKKPDRFLPDPVFRYIDKHRLYRIR